MPRGLSVYESAKIQGRLWTPAILRPDLWLDAVDFSSISVDGGVSQWRDKSGYNRHFSQTDINKRPIYQINGISGLPSILYDGINDDLIRPVENWMYVYPLNFFIVFKANSFNGSAYNTLFEFYSDIFGSTSGWGIIIRNFGKSAIYVTTTGGQVNYDSTGNLTYNTNTTYLMSGTIQNNNITSFGNAFIDGTISSNFNMQTTIGSGFVSIGANSRFNRFTNWLIGEVIIVNRQMSQLEIQSTIGYIAHKWKFAFTLPSNFSYINNPPLIGC